jgi:hypothetical protein
MFTSWHTTPEEQQDLRPRERGVGSTVLRDDRLDEEPRHPG